MITLDFHLALERIRPHIRETKVTRLPGSELHLKWESHQPTRSFKVRGAFNKMLLQNPLPDRVITGSAGNHGQAVALAAKKLGVEAHVFVPQAAPNVKIDRMRALGARVTRVAGLYGDAEAAAIRAAGEAGVPFISPYNDPDVITGAGTIALELLSQKPVKRILVPVGGGGLVCGVGLAAKKLDPDIEIVGVLSEASPYLFHQFYDGTMEGVVEQPTLTDGLAGAVEPGSVTIDWISQAADRILQVTEQMVAAAIVTLYQKTGEVVEGSGAVGPAAVLSGLVPADDIPTIAIISGGNIDADKLSALVNAAQNGNAGLKAVARY